MLLDRKTVPTLFPIHLPSYPSAVSWSLKNGKKCLLLNDSQTPLLRLSLVCSIGHLGGESEGILKLIPYLLDKGTRHRSAKEVANKLAEEGVSLEVKSTKDRLSIEMMGLADGVNALIPLLAELVYKPSFEKKELLLAKKQLIQKLRYQREQPSRFTQSHFLKTCFGQKHLYGHILLSKELQPITKEKLESIYQEALVDTWTIYVAGAIKPLTKELIQAYFGKNKLTGSQTLKTPLASYSPTVIRKKKKNNLQANIAIGFPTLTLSDPDYILLKIVTILLGGYFGSRLMQNLREKRGYTYGVTSHIIPFVQKGLWMLSAEIDREKVRSALKEIRKEISKIKTEPVSQEEIQLLRRYISGSYLAQLETVFDLQAALIQLDAHDLDFTFYNRLSATLEEITPADIKHISRKYLQWEHMTLLVTT